MKSYFEELLEGPGLERAFLRILCRWVLAKKPDEKTSSWEETLFIFKKIFAYVFLFKLVPGYHGFITRITAYYPFSLLFRNYSYHAKNLLAKKFIDETEALTKKTGLPIVLGDVYIDRYLSEISGRFEKKIIHKKKTMEKLQQLLQEKYGAVYVQPQKDGFKLQVDTKLIKKDDLIS